MTSSRPPGNGNKYTRTGSKTHAKRSAQFSLSCRRWTATHPGVVVSSLPWRWEKDRVLAAKGRDIWRQRWRRSSGRLRRGGRARRSWAGQQGG